MCSSISLNGITQFCVTAHFFLHPLPTWSTNFTWHLRLFTCNLQYFPLELFYKHSLCWTFSSGSIAGVSSCILFEKRALTPCVTCQTIRPIRKYTSDSVATHTFKHDLCCAPKCQDLFLCQIKRCHWTHIYLNEHFFLKQIQMFWHAVGYLRFVFVATDVAWWHCYVMIQKKLFLTSSISCRQKIMNGTFERKKIIIFKKKT